MVKKPFKCSQCESTFNGVKPLKTHERTHKREKAVDKLKIAAININCEQQAVTKKTFNEKEADLLDIILERDFDVIGVSECDIQDFDPKRPFKWTGYRTFFDGKRRL